MPTIQEDFAVAQELSKFDPDQNPIIPNLEQFASLEDAKTRIEERKKQGDIKYHEYKQKKAQEKPKTLKETWDNFVQSKLLPNSDFISNYEYYEFDQMINKDNTKAKNIIKIEQKAQNNITSYGISYEINDGIIKTILFDNATKKLTKKIQNNVEEEYEIIKPNKTNQNTVRNLSMSFKELGDVNSDVGKLKEKLKNLIKEEEEELELKKEKSGFLCIGSNDNEIYNRILKYKAAIHLLNNNNNNNNNIKGAFAVLMLTQKSMDKLRKKGLKEDTLYNEMFDYAIENPKKLKRVTTAMENVMKGDNAIKDIFIRKMLGDVKTKDSLHNTHDSELEELKKGSDGKFIRYVMELSTNNPGFFRRMTTASKARFCQDLNLQKQQKQLIQ